MKAGIPIGEDGVEKKADLHEIFSLIKHSCVINSSFVSSAIKATIMHLLLVEHTQSSAGFSLVQL